ncbi:MAG: thermostable hemolysin [Burkholderiales bacterium]
MQPAGSLRPVAQFTGAPLNEPSSAWRFGVAEEDERPRIRGFIASAFEQAYGARLRTFMPELAALYRAQALVGACGLRRARDERLFLETYLEAPVEQVLLQVTEWRSDRSDLVEVGNLAIGRPGAARALIAHLTTHLLQSGTRYVVFTAVPTLRNSFVRLGIALHALGEASAKRLAPEARAEWGTYYEQRPAVMCVAVADAARSLGITR